MNSAEQITYVMNLLDQADSSYRDVAMQAAELQADYDLEFAQWFGKGTGSVDARKYNATIAVSDLRKQLEIAKAKDRYLSSRIRSLQARLTASQSLLRFESGRS